MTLRRLHHEQPESFEFTPENLAWAKEQIAKYPPGRQASAVIPILWRAQEQEGWVTRPMIEYVARLLDMAPIRVLEVATFYFMFQLRPVGSVAHVQVCGTTSCMICGSEALIEVCKRRIAPRPHELSPDGRFSWEEVECLGACANAPMVQIGKDYYEDLTPESFEAILDAFARGEVPRPGPQNGRFASEPAGGPTTLAGPRFHEANASVTLALERGDTIGRVLGPGRVAKPWEGEPTRQAAAAERPAAPAELPTAVPPRLPESRTVPAVEAAAEERRFLAAPEGKPDDLKRIKGIGPKLEKLLNSLGIYHYRQIAALTPEDIAWLDERLQFKGRIERDDWVGQAKKLAGEE